MDRIEFRISSLNEERRRRLKRRSTSSSRLPSRTAVGRWLSHFRLGKALLTMPVPILAVLALTIGAGWNGAYVQINGTVVRGENILFVEDISGSMAPWKEEVKQQIALLPVSARSRETVQGFGASVKGTGENLLHTLSDKLAIHAGVDTVYVFSDFNPMDDYWDCDDREGLKQFRDLILQNHLRLYLSTVNMFPSPGLFAIARESGGDLVGVNPNPISAEQEAKCQAYQ